MPRSSSNECWRVSSGSAAVLGLCTLRMDTAPTTAYLMLGERCSRNCAFCTQARESAADAGALSRVLWPAFPSEQVASVLAQAYSEGLVRRACFQVTVSAGYLETVQAALAEIKRHSSVPVCCSVAPRNAEDVACLLLAGADRVTIALDAACERVYERVKGGNWQQTLGLLESCGRLYPGRIATHLIVGLGETEREMVDRMQRLTRLGIAYGLFAFTPVAGTAMAGQPPPPLQQYRRMQAARWLLVKAQTDAAVFVYTSEGRLVGYGLSTEALRALLADGEAFRTSGCPDCNRPYYNERPGGVMYNYPRPLTAVEAAAELDALLAGLAEGC